MNKFKVFLYSRWILFFTILTLIYYGIRYGEKIISPFGAIVHLIVILFIAIEFSYKKEKRKTP
ncbi:hypothetical protein [Alkaliphilus metalliredigens]|uniref:hypothetical protein n=1 Tax=Alkaliphilus metalliredigens TaxID=208226 RepID=UPI0005A0601F|nr:hypothetical protein [Alkaliphilus metalliredigens]